MRADPRPGRAGTALTYGALSPARRGQTSLHLAGPAPSRPPVAELVRQARASRNACELVRATALPEPARRRVEQLADQLDQLLHAVRDLEDQERRP